MLMIEILMLKLSLMLKLVAAYPSIDVVTAYQHASAAVDHSDATLRPELLLGMAYVESRFDPTATSRIEGNVRRTGSYPSLAPPRGGVRGSLFCGPLQAHAKTWQQCLALRELAAGYAAGATEMRTWLRDGRVAGSVRRALIGHGCGNHGLAANRCRGYPARVLRFAARLGYSARERPDV
jgi:hypothetical protein